MKKILLLIILISILSINVFADGGYFPPAPQLLSIPEQKAVIAWDGSKEILTLSSKVSMNEITDVAWIVPVKSSAQPNVEEGDIQIFYDLQELFNPPKMKAPSFALGGMGDEAGIQGLEILEIKQVDIYNIIILKATNANTLVEWLNTQNYFVPETAIPLLQEYASQENVYFIANKVNLSNKYNLDPTEQDKECARVMNQEIENYDNYYEEIYSDYKYSQANTIEERMYYLWEQAEVKNEEECIEADFFAVQALVELNQGVATPLKITFFPEEPMYPLKISSLNEGSTEIEVFVFSNTPMKDKNEIMNEFKMTENTINFATHYGLNQKYVTYLKYNGALNALNKDAVFEETTYNSELDPHVYDFEDTEDGYLILILLEIFVFFIIFIMVPLIVIAAIIYFVVKYLKKKKGKK
ncbi:MAG: DUF2330 domain-containing protein [Candidatus Diapherotrites archaeon]